MPKAEKDEILYCSLCDGHGTYKGGVCPACGGVGKFLDSNKWVYCNLCNGHGVYNGKPCPTCGGRGKVRPASL